MTALRIPRARVEFDLIPFGGGYGLLHDASNGARTTSALCVATQALIDLFRGVGKLTRQKRAHVMVGEHIAGADNHCKGKHSAAQ